MQITFLGFHATGTKTGLGRNVALYVSVVPNFRSDIRWFVVIRRWLWRIPAAKPVSSLSFLHINQGESTQKPQTNKQREKARARDLGNAYDLPLFGIQYRLLKVGTSQMFMFFKLHASKTLLYYKYCIMYIRLTALYHKAFPIVAAAAGGSHCFACAWELCSTWRSSLSSRQD